MLNKKDSFIVRKKYQNQIAKLTKEQKADLLDRIFEYQNTWRYEEASWWVDMLLSIMVDEWEKDDEKYKEECERNKKNWKLWWRPKKNQQNRTVSEKPKKADSDYDSDYDSDSDYINVERGEKSKKLFGAIVELTQDEYDRLAAKFWETTIKKYIINMDSYCVEHNKRYKDYNLALQKWIAKDNVKEKPPQKKQLSEFEIEEWVYDLEKLNAFSSYPT